MWNGFLALLYANWPSSLKKINFVCAVYFSHDWLQLRENKFLFQQWEYGPPIQCCLKKAILISQQTAISPPVFYPWCGKASTDLGICLFLKDRSFPNDTPVRCYRDLGQNISELKFVFAQLGKPLFLTGVSMSKAPPAANTSDSQSAEGLAWALGQFTFWLYFRRVIIRTTVAISMELGFKIRVWPHTTPHSTTSVPWIWNKLLWDVDHCLKHGTESKMGEYRNKNAPFLS